MSENQFIASPEETTQPIPDPLRASFAFHLAEGEAVRRPEVIQEMAFEHVFSRSPFSTAPFARAIVPIELVQPGDTQIVSLIRSGIEAMRPLSIDFLADFPSVTSVVAAQMVMARRLLPQVRELFVLNPLGTADQETLSHLPGLESLSLGSSVTTREVKFEEIETYDYDADKLYLNVLHGMPRLRDLRFNAFVVRSLEPLREMKSLERLWIEGIVRGERSAAPLASLTNLRWLMLECTKCLHLLKDLHKLERVEWLDVNLASLKPFKAWKRLKSLALAGRGVKSLEGIGAMESLQELFLGRTGVQDLSPLEDAHNLRQLNLRCADRVRSFSPIHALPNLNSLTIDLGSISSIAHLPDIDFLAGLENLEELNIIGAVIDDGRLEALFDLPRLSRVRLLGNYGAQGEQLRSFHPCASLKVTPLQAEPAGTAIQVGEITLRKLSTGEWSIFQDLSEMLGAAENFSASRKVQKAIRQQEPALLKRLDFDPDADFVSIIGQTEEDVRRAAEIIQSIAVNKHASI